MTIADIIKDASVVIALASAVCASLPKSLQAKLGPVPAILQALALNVGHASPATPAAEAPAPVANSTTTSA